MNPDAKKIAGQIAGMILAFALVLFVPAGTLAWPAGWAFLILFFGFVAAISYWLLGHNPDLLRERMNGVIQTGQKTWDQAIIIVTGGLFFAWLILMPLDAARFHWSQMPAGFQVAGAFILLCSFVLFFLTFRENPYMSPVVRTQAERGQTVVSSGPYRVRASSDVLRLSPVRNRHTAPARLVVRAPRRIGPRDTGRGAGCMGGAPVAEGTRGLRGLHG